MFKIQVRLMWGIFGAIAIMGLFGCTPEYSLVVEVEPENSGVVERSPDQEKYEEGTLVTLTAEPASGYVFDAWTGDLESTETPGRVRMNADLKITALFAAVDEEGEPEEGEGEGEPPDIEGEPEEDPCEDYDSAPAEEDFAITEAKYPEDANWDQVVLDTFGEEYRVADWQDLMAYYCAGGDVLALFDSLGLTDYRPRAFVTRDGSRRRTSTRYYYVVRHENNPPDNWFRYEVDDISDHMVSLGSWHTLQLPILAVTGRVLDVEGEGEPEEGEGEPEEGEPEEGEGEPEEGEPGEGEGEPEEGEGEPEEGEEELALDFHWTPTLVWVGDTVDFEAEITTDNGAAIEAYHWDLGDGTEQTGELVSHSYSGPDVYTVVLTVQTGDEEVSHTRNVTVDQRPTASFSVEPDTAYVFMDAVDFILDDQPDGARPIESYLWEFGDGTETDDVAPTHQYLEAGDYEARLTISYKHSRAGSEDPLETAEAEQTVTTIPSLYSYITKDDGCYDYTQPRVEEITWTQQTQFGPVDIPVATAYMVDRLTSQCWNPDGAVYDDYVEWIHAVTIVTPEHKVSDKALLFIDGGSRNSVAVVEEMVEYIAVLTGTTVVHVKNIPSQPIFFNEEVIPPGEEDNFSDEDFRLRRRTEDAIIAYSYRQYIESYRDTDGDANAEWPLLFPMAKAAVKAMDMTEEILGGLDEPVPVDSFVVSGGSKRGWTTWMAGAVDERVSAVAPLVINVLNMVDHLVHHRAAYGYWSPAIYDYAQEQVFDEMMPATPDEPVLPEAQRLLDYVDPYQYALRGRYPMPKFMLNATGDEFFVPDTAELYYHDLEQDAHLCYVPNVGHGMGDLDPEMDITDPSNPLGMFLAWYMAVTQDQPLPRFTYSFEENGAIRLSADPDSKPTVRLWHATQPVPGLRDFRNHMLPHGAWTSLMVQEHSQGVYMLEPPHTDETMYTGFFAQLEFENYAKFPAELRIILESAGYEVPNLVFTTGVRVVPEAFPEFTGYVANEVRPDLITFEEAELPVVVVYGTPYEMGYYYGQLLSHEINAFIPAFLDAYKQENDLDDAWLADAWQVVVPDLDPRIVDEIQGIAEAPGVTVSLTELQHAHAAVFREAPGRWDAATTVAYRELIQDGNATAGHAITLNGPMDRNLHNHLCAILYVPEKGAPHTVFTYAGLVVGHVGANLGGISGVEIPEPMVSSMETGNTLPLMRTVLYDAFSLRDAIALFKDMPPTYETTVVFADGRNEQRGVLLRTDSAGSIVEERYDLAPEFGVTHRGILYAAAADVEPFLHSLLDDFMPDALPLNTLSLMTNQPPMADDDNNVFNALVDSMGMNIYFSNALYESTASAPNRTLPMQFLLP